MSELVRGHWYLQSDGTVQYLSETATIVTFEDDGPIKLCGVTIKDSQPLEVVKAGTVAELKQQLESRGNKIFELRQKLQEKIDHPKDDKDEQHG